MSIAAVPASSTTAAVATTSSENSKYTPVLDKIAKALAPGSKASFDDQLEAVGGLMKLMWGNGGDQAALLHGESQDICDRAAKVFRDSDIIKRAQIIGQRMMYAQQSIIDSGNFSSVEDLQLQTLSKFSTEDQKLQFVASSNGAFMPISDGGGGMSLRQH